MPIPGQPGLYRAGLRGLGAPPLDVLQSKLTAAQSMYDATKTSMAPLLAAYGPLDQDALKRLVVAIQQQGNVRVILGAGSFVGLLRMGLAAAIGNISRAASILSGTPAGHEDLIVVLLDTAQNVLDQLNTIISAATTAQGAAAAGLRTFGLSGMRRSGLGAFGVDDATLAILAVVGVIIGAALVYGLVSRVQDANNARATADTACERDAAAGHPCTGAQWAQYQATADAAAHTQSLVPDFADILHQVGNVVLYGGLLAVAAVLGYGLWTTLPAARAARGALTSRAQRLSGLNGTPAQHRAKAEQLLGKARREIERGRYMDALITASAANAEAQWVDERLKGETYHEVVMAKAGLRMEAGR